MSKIHTATLTVFRNVVSDSFLLSDLPKYVFSNFSQF